MSHTLTVTTDDATLSCAIFIDRRFIPGTDEGPVELILRQGEHSLTYDVRGPGAEVGISIAGDPAAQIIVPPDETWPFKVSVPADRTAGADRLYFVVGG